MTIKEKVAYLQGLTEGMNTDETEDGRLFAAIIDILADMANEIADLSESTLEMSADLDALAEEVGDLNENALDIGDELDALSDDLADVERFIEELDLDDEDFDLDFDCDDDDDDWDDWLDDDLDDEDYDGDDNSDCDVAFSSCDGCPKADGAGFSIDVNCPECNAALELSEIDIAKESVTCPACGREIELEIDEVDVDDN